MAPSTQDSNEIGNPEKWETNWQTTSGMASPKVPSSDTENTEIPAMGSPEPSPQDTAKQEPHFVKLNTAEKRRFKKALAEGLSRKEALERAKKPEERKYPLKRNFTAERYSRESIKKSRLESCTINMGLMPRDLYQNPFTTEDLDRLQEAIIDAAIETGCEIKPQFKGCHPRRGWLMVSCSNANTAEWLQMNVDIIKSKSDLDLQIIEEADFPQTYYVHGTFPNSQGLANFKILGTIEAQNQLKATSWRVLQRKWSEGSNVELSLAVDKKSWQELRKIKGHIAYRFGHIHLKLQQNHEKSSHKRSGYSEKPSPDSVRHSTSQKFTERKSSNETSTFSEYSSQDFSGPSTSQEASSRNFYSSSYNQTQSRNPFASPEPIFSTAPAWSQPPPQALLPQFSQQNRSWQGDASIQRFSSHEASRRPSSTNIHNSQLPYNRRDDHSQSRDRHYSR
ncbi:uncharacterized protein LOC133328154 [Musca vetustissima]|uniref:uncharacterized protein LOC133328154 n=1 Tax=Musca vetustissima TaxID=27455 RepID=UPI002AB70E12|nr:uncharacterized protein LOC133328154 [Musca vetustissima]